MHLGGAGGFACPFFVDSLEEIVGSAATSFDVPAGLAARTPRHVGAGEFAHGKPLRQFRLVPYPPHPAVPPATRPRRHREAERGREQLVRRRDHLERYCRGLDSWPRSWMACEK